MLVSFPVCLLSHARLRCMCTCNRCTFCLCQNFLNSELLQMVRAKLYTVVLRRSFIFTTPSDSDLPLSQSSPICHPPTPPILFITLEILSHFSLLLVWVIIWLPRVLSCFLFVLLLGWSTSSFFAHVTLPQREARDAKPDSWSCFFSCHLNYNPNICVSFASAPPFCLLDIFFFLIWSFLSTPLTTESSCLHLER